MSKNKGEARNQRGVYGYLEGIKEALDDEEYEYANEMFIELAEYWPVVYKQLCSISVRENKK